MLMQKLYFMPLAWGKKRPYANKNPAIADGVRSLT